jgi:hypothetical protein
VNGLELSIRLALAVLLAAAIAALALHAGLAWLGRGLRLR